MPSSLSSNLSEVLSAFSQEVSDHTSAYIDAHPDRITPQGGRHILFDPKSIANARTQWPFSLLRTRDGSIWTTKLGAVKNYEERGTCLVVHASGKVAGTTKTVNDLDDDVVEVVYVAYML